MSIDSACVAAHRIRRAVADCAIVLDEGTISVTISVGVSVTHGGLDGIPALIKEADVALYEAKRTGRNRVCVFGRSESDAGEARIREIGSAKPALKPIAKSA
jgi:diguanylate cyclase (GGDEF)-like protein